LHKRSVLFDVLASYFIGIFDRSICFCWPTVAPINASAETRDSDLKWPLWEPITAQQLASSTGVHYDTLHQVRYDCGSFLSEGQTTKKGFLFLFSIHGRAAQLVNNKKDSYVMHTIPIDVKLYSAGASKINVNLCTF
jgi:hypothetical protein